MRRVTAKTLRSRSGDRRPLGAEGEDHAGPTAVSVLGHDLASMRLGDLSHDRQPETRPGHAPRRARAIEPVEDVREVLVRDPGSVVANDEPTVPNLDLDLRARCTPLRGVVEEVADCTLERGRNASYGRGLELGHIGHLG